MKSSASSKSKAPTLRSSSLLRQPPPAGSQRASTGFSSIRLDTYHDTSGLKAALRELEEAFTPSPPAASASKAGGAPDGAPSAAAAAASVKLATPQRATRAKGSAAAVEAAAPVTLPRRARACPLLTLPLHLMVRCFSFCDLRTLGVLCGVSVRLNVIVAQQGAPLWLAAAQRRGISIAVPAVAREELRNVLVHRARERHAEEAYYEAEIARMEERLTARAHDIYAQNVDVNETLRSNGAVAGAPTPSSVEPYWLRQQHTADGRKTGSTELRRSDQEFVGTAGQVAEMRVRLQGEIESLEKAKRTWESRLQLQEELLNRQEAQLQLWQALLLPSGAAASTGPAAAAAEESDATDGGAAPASIPMITALQLDDFERRVARLVLSGPPTVATVADFSTGIGSAAAPLPVVLRRGVESFASLELALRVMGHEEGGEATAPKARGAALEAGGISATAGGAAAVRAAGKRWTAFQQFCPINEEYQNARMFLKAEEARSATAAAASAWCSSQRLTSVSGRSDEPPLSLSQSQPPPQRRPSAKQMPALLRVSGFVRRVEAMTDAQVLQSWM